MTEMRAKVTKEFDGVEDGKVYPRLITVGEEISGALAETAVTAGNAKETKDSKAERSAADESTLKAMLEKQDEDDARALAEAKRQEGIAKLALLSKEQIAALAAEHNIDIAGLKSEEDVIDAMQRGMAALELEIPSPTDASKQEPEKTAP